MAQGITETRVAKNVPWKLPDGWEWVPLGEACQINPRRPQIVRDDDTPTSFLPMPGVDEVDGMITICETRPYREVARGFTYFEDGNVLFAKITPSMQNGKCAIARGLIDGIGFGSTEFHVIRPGTGITADWVHRYMRRLAFRLEAMEHFRGAVGQQRVPEEFIRSSLIPVPPSVEIQRRIVARIEAIVAEVKRARGLLEQMEYHVSVMTKSVLRAAIEEVDKGCSDSASVRELISNGQIKLTGGGTPSKKNERYWTGTIPWVSPKDMKRWYINDTQDHISAEALEETTVILVPKASVLIVVRGMILAHSLPVGITMNEVTINQDMKALTPKGNLSAEYVGYIIRARSQSILQNVEIAAHGTRRLKTETLLDVRIPEIPMHSQKRIVGYLNAVETNVEEMQRLLNSSF